MKKPLLSICIPTFNRVMYLKNNLDHIIVQDEFKNGNVEVIISDNVSEDDTQKLGMLYSSEYENIKYFRNEVNNLDQNFPLAISRGSGMLRMLSNDTLEYLPDALSYICDVVRKTEKTRPLIFFANGLPNLNYQEQLVDFPAFMTDASYWTTAVQTFSIWDDDCDSIENDIAGCELHLWQVKKILEVMHIKKFALICNKNLAIKYIFKNKDVTYGVYKVFHDNYLKLISPYLKNGDLSFKVFDFLEMDLLFNLLIKFIIWEKERGYIYSHDEDILGNIKRDYQDKPYWNDFVKYYEALKNL